MRQRIMIKTYPVKSNSSTKTVRGTAFCSKCGQRLNLDDSWKMIKKRETKVNGVPVFVDMDVEYGHQECIMARRKDIIESNCYEIVEFKE